MTPLITRNTIILTNKTQIWITYLDDKTFFNMKAFESEYSMAKNNHLIGHFAFTGISPAPRGVPQIQMTSSRSRFSKEKIEHLVADPVKYQKEL